MPLHPVTLNVPVTPGGSPDYGRVIALRRMAMHYTDFPRRKSLPCSTICRTGHNTVWSTRGGNTGAQINEALALKRRDFRLNDDIPHMVIRTTNQRRTGGDRPQKGKSANRVVVLSDADYVREMRNLFASTRERFEVDSLIGEKSAIPVVIAPI